MSPRRSCRAQGLAFYEIYPKSLGHMYLQRPVTPRTQPQAQGEWGLRGSCCDGIGGRDAEKLPSNNSFEPHEVSARSQGSAFGCGMKCAMLAETLEQALSLNTRAVPGPGRQAACQRSPRVRGSGESLLPRERLQETCELVHPNDIGRQSNQRNGQRGIECSIG